MDQLTQLFLGIRGWSDSSGGDSHELAFDGGGAIYHRHGATTSWNAWTKLVEDNDSRLTNSRPASDVHGWAKAEKQTILCMERDR